MGKSFYHTSLQFNLHMILVEISYLFIHTPQFHHDPTKIDIMIILSFGYSGNCFFSIAMANIQLYCHDFFDIPYIIIICTMMILLNIMILLWLMGDPFCDLRLIHIRVRLVLSEIMFTMHRRHVLNIVSIMKKSICTIFGSCKDSMLTTIMSNLCVYPISTLIRVYNQRFALYASSMYQCDLQLYISHAISV